MININKIYNTIITEIMDMDTSDQTEYETYAAIYSLMAKLERCNLETNLNNSIKNRRKKNAKKEKDNINTNRRDPVQ